MSDERFNYSDLEHRDMHDEYRGCAEVCQRVLDIMCFRCPVNFACHSGGTVNHEQMQLCMLSCLYCNTKERPSRLEDIAFIPSYEEVFKRRLR